MIERREQRRMVAQLAGCAVACCVVAVDVGRTSLSGAFTVACLAVFVAINAWNVRTLTCDHVVMLSWPLAAKRKRLPVRRAKRKPEAPKTETAS